MTKDEVVTTYSASVPVNFGETITTYTVQIIHSEDGYAVGCPVLPGCWSQGETEAEALSNIADAIKDYIEVSEELKQRELLQLHKVA